MRQILLKYARTKRQGAKLARCGPSNYERAMRERYGNWKHLPKMKIIFDSRALAQAAADELTDRLGWARQRPYACNRSSHGHHHLTHDGGKKRRTEGGDTNGAAGSSDQ